MLKNTSSSSPTECATPNDAISWTSRIRKRPPSLVFEGLGTDLWLQTSPNTTSSITVTNTSIPVLTSAGGSNPSLRRTDSAMNSLECWDYSVELECLQGPDGREMFCNNYKICCVEVLAFNYLIGKML